MKKLISIEKKDSNGPTTMNKIVRVDVGVMKENGKYQYFVNEVTRALEMNLFSRTIRNPNFVKIVGHVALESIKDVIEYRKKVE